MFSSHLKDVLTPDTTYRWLRDLPTAIWSIEEIEIWAISSLHSACESPVNATAQQSIDVNSELLKGEMALVARMNVRSCLAARKI